jgi:hypothetical protein
VTKSEAPFNKTKLPSFGHFPFFLHFVFKCFSPLRAGFPPEAELNRFAASSWGRHFGEYSNMISSAFSVMTTTEQRLIGGEPANPEMHVRDQESLSALEGFLS